MTEALGNLEHSNRYYGSGLDRDAWFRVAERDYVELVDGVDWTETFSELEPPRTLLDVGCGTGRFPELLAASGRLPSDPVRYDYLDPSPHCLSVLPAALRPPFTPGVAHRSTLEAFASKSEATERYGLIWCIHSLYTTEPDALPEALAGLVAHLQPQSGRCLAYIAEPTSFYVRFYERYLRSNRARHTRPLTHAGDVRMALRGAGIQFEQRHFEFPHEVERSEDRVLGRYLSQCAFERRTAQAWLRHGDLGPFLESFSRGSAFSFPQQVTLFSFGK